MAAGDTISGTVVTEPAGKTDRDRAANSDTLDDYEIDIAGNRVDPKQRTLRFVVPAVATAIPLLLKDQSGAETLSGVIPLPGASSNGPEPFRRKNGPPNTQSGPRDSPEPSGPEPFRVKSPPPTVESGPRAGGNPNGPEPYRFSPANTPKFYTPRVAQIGKPIPVTGPFDGDFSNTRVRLNGQIIEPLAESPHSLIVLNPALGSGTQTLVIRERGMETELSVTSLAIRLSVTKTTLMTGESATLTVTVSDLKDLSDREYPVTCVVSNANPATVSLGALETVVHHIERTHVNPDGAAAFTLPLLGRSAGAFSLSGAVTSSPNLASDRLLSPLDMKNRKNLKNLEGASEQDLLDTLQILRDRKQFDKEHGKDSQKWFAEKIRLVKRALNEYDGRNAPDEPNDN